MLFSLFWDNIIRIVSINNFRKACHDGTLNFLKIFVTNESLESHIYEAR